MPKGQGTMRRFGLIVAGGAMLMQAAAANAQTQARGMRLPCHDYAEIARQLRATYEEAPVSLGLQSDGNLLQVFSSRKTGSWTIVSTSPKGFACVLAAGQHWESLTPVSLDPAA
jgi:hypothetical protein